MDIESTSSPSWLVQTKLLPPELHVNVNARPRLVGALLHAVRTSRLTLLSAPAGYGKTTLLASLPKADPSLPIAWISLDEEDNDPARFIGALVEVIRRLEPCYNNSAQLLLDSLSNPVLDLRRVLGVMINEIIESLPDPFVVVLDDLHLVTDPAILTALERMPAQMHLIIATRHDPPLSLARLRAHRRVTEIRLADLRFTVKEVADFLNDSLGLDLSAETHVVNVVSELEKPTTERFAAPWMALYYWNLARVRWQQGKIADARAIHSTMVAAANPRARSIAPVTRTMLAGLLAISDGRNDVAESLLEDAADRQASAPTTTVAGQATTLLAYLRLTQNRPAEAVMLIEPLLERHEREGTPGIILWDGPAIVAPLLESAIERGVCPRFAASLLTLIGNEPAVQPRVSVPETGETLTAREIELLRLIAAGHGNPSIADQLYISVHTVKRHVANLLDKLGASSRTQAAVRGRELGII